eukprot:2284412-Pyramimonas_sp.AAC.1
MKMTMAMPTQQRRMQHAAARTHAGLNGSRDGANASVKAEEASPCALHLGNENDRMDGSFDEPK